MSGVLRNSMGAEKSLKVPESLHRKTLKELAQSPTTEEDTTRNLLEKAKRTCVGELMWERY